jgi:hypothetical protein
MKKIASAKLRKTLDRHIADTDALGLQITQAIAAGVTEGEELLPACAELRGKLEQIRSAYWPESADSGVSA